MMAFTVEVSRKGMKNMGFIMRGTPKMIGSEMLKNAGTMPTRPMVRSCLDLERMSRMARASTEPQPPITTK